MLNLEEEQFWEATPRKILLLLDQHIKYNQLIHGIEPEQEKNDEDAFNALLKL